MTRQWLVVGDNEAKRPLGRPFNGKYNNNCNAAIYAILPGYARSLYCSGSYNHTRQRILFLSKFDCLNVASCFAFVSLVKATICYYKLTTALINIFSNKFNTGFPEITVADLLFPALVVSAQISVSK